MGGSKRKHSPRTPRTARVPIFMRRHRAELVAEALQVGVIWEAGPLGSPHSLGRLDTTLCLEQHIVEGPGPRNGSLVPILPHLVPSLSSSGN